MEGTPPMSLSEDETGVKLIIIIYYYDDLIFIELNCHLNWSDELEVRKVFVRWYICQNRYISFRSYSGQGYTNLFQTNTNLLQSTIIS